MAFQWSIREQLVLGRRGPTWFKCCTYILFFFFYIGPNQSSFIILISTIFTVHMFNTIHTSQGRVYLTGRAGSYFLQSILRFPSIHHESELKPSICFHWLLLIGIFWIIASVPHIHSFYCYVWKQAIWLPLSSPFCWGGTQTRGWDHSLRMRKNWCSNPLCYGVPLSVK